MPRARIIAQALPLAQHRFLIRRRQGGNVGEAGHPAVEVVHAALHLRLLEHNLRNPDLIGRVVDAPGQTALIDGKPVQQGALDAGDVLLRRRKGLRHAGGRACRR